MEKNYRTLESLLESKNYDEFYDRNGFKSMKLERVNEMSWQPKLTISKINGGDVVLLDYMPIFEFIRKLK